MDSVLEKTGHFVSSHHGATRPVMLIHVSRDGQQFGPYTPEDVQGYLADGSLLTTDLGWVEGTADWVPLPQLVSGGAAPPPAILGITCPKCGAGLESDQVICLA